MVELLHELNAVNGWLAFFYMVTAMTLLAIVVNGLVLIVQSICAIFVPEYEEDFEDVVPGVEIDEEKP